MSRTFRLSYFTGELDKKPRPIEVTWDQLAQQLTSPIMSPCTLETCGKGEHALVIKDKHKGCKHKYVGAWSPAVYPAGLNRAKSNVGAVSVIVLDIDHVTDVQLVEIDQRLRPYRYIAHATHGDRPNDRALRIVLEPSAPIAGPDWDRFWPTMIDELGLPKTDRKTGDGGADRQTSDASRLYFLPTRPNDAGFLCDTNEGSTVDVAAIMAKAPPPAPHEPITLPNAVGVASLEKLQAAAVQLAAAWPPKGRHTTSLALAGALASHGWPEDTIAAFIGEVTRLTGSEPEIDKRLDHASDSIAKLQRGERVSGWGTLAGCLTRPEAIDVVRDLLGMRDATTDLIDGLFNTTPPTPVASVSDSYPINLDAIDAFKTQAQAVPEVTAEPGTFPAFLQQARRDIAVALGSAPDAAGSAAPMFIRARDLFSMTFPATPWLVQGLITEKGVAAVLAEPKSTKTWLALELALSVASGTAALGKYGCPKAIPTAYFFAEDQAQAVKVRLAALSAGRGMRPEDLTSNLHIQPRGQTLDILKDEDVARIIASCRAIGGIGLLVLDPLRDIQTGKENDSDDMSAVFKRLKLIGTLLDCTVLVVHHAKRANKDKPQDEGRPGSDARGSSAIEGALDAIISMRDLRTNGVDEFSNTVVTQIKNAKSAGTFPLTLKIKDDKHDQAEHAAWTIGGETPKVSAQTFDELILACLEHMMTCEIKKEPTQTTDKIRKAVSRKYELVAAAMIEGERACFVMPNKVGNRQVGWMLTDRGRDHVQKAHELPATRAVAEAPSSAPLPGGLTMIDMTGITPQTGA